jgi:glycosyltransferase involved in cell wall biosynthesis
LPPLLSIIIPALNEEHRLPGNLRRVLDFLKDQAYSSELIVVDSGSQDQTSAVVEQFIPENANLHLYREELRGKGRAVRRGMIEAKGQYRFICDADLSMPIKNVNKFLPPTLEDFDIAIASREVPGAVRYHEPAYRHWIGRGFNLLVRLLAIPQFHDTQCGFKCFRGEIAEDLFSVQQLQGWGFDVEVLFVAVKRGYRIVEVPIPWYFNPDSRVRLLQDSIGMFGELIQIRRNWKKGIYAPRD